LPLVGLAVALLNGCGDIRARQQQQIMDQVERTVVLRQAFMAKWSPPRAVAAYDRYYTWTEDGRKVEAVYTLYSGSPGRRWVNRPELPVTMDGGCGFIKLRYDVAAKRVEWVRCNGGA
jgi:hypothetical protein